MHCYELIMQPIIFRFAEARNKGRRMLGSGPSFQGLIPLPATYLRIFGVTKDGAGSALGGCVVHLFRTSDDSLADVVVSDGSGNYEFRSGSLSTNYYVVAYKQGSPDLSGTSVNTLIAA